jgi:hypothetical protein
MGERFDKFREIAGETYDSVTKYKNHFDLLMGLFPKNSSAVCIEGQVDIPRIKPFVGAKLPVTVLINREHPNDKNSLNVELAIKVGENNYSKIETFILQPPARVTEGEISKINNDEVFEIFIAKLQMDSGLRDGFRILG